MEFYSSGAEADDQDLADWLANRSDAVGLVGE
jgi:hypothetical protein